jgi:fanconi-associated nuclease 1
MFADNARFVLVRLCLRKSEKWFRTSDLEKYRSELGDGMQAAMDELCRNAKLELQEQRKLKMKLEEESREIIEISDDEQRPAVQTEHLLKTEDDIKSEPGPSNIIADHCIPTILAKDEDYAELSELLDCLTADELRGLVKSMKAGDPKNKKVRLVKNLKLYSFDVFSERI